MTPMTRIASVARFSASVWPEMRIARACWTCGGATTATVRTVAFGSSAWAGLAASSVAALPTDENLPVPIQAAKPTRTTNAMSLFSLSLGMIVLSDAGRRLDPSFIFGATPDVGMRKAVFNPRARAREQVAPSTATT